jgi:hypothetical protein
MQPFPRASATVVTGQRIASPHDHPCRPSPASSNACGSSFVAGTTAGGPSPLDGPKPSVEGSGRGCSGRRVDFAHRRADGSRGLLLNHPSLCPLGRAGLLHREPVRKLRCRGNELSRLASVSLSARGVRLAAHASWSAFWLAQVKLSTLGWIAVTRGAYAINLRSGDEPIAHRSFADALPCEHCPLGPHVSASDGLSCWRSTSMRPRGHCSRTQVDSIANQGAAHAIRPPSALA